MLFKSEIEKIKSMVNKLITLANDKIDCLNRGTLQDQIKSEKTIADLLNKLAKLTIDISKLPLGEDNNNFKSEVDQNIIAQFYSTYKIKEKNDNKKPSSRSNSKK